jgi:hypothetical protein
LTRPRLPSRLATSPALFPFNAVLFHPRRPLSQERQKREALERQRAAEAAAEEKTAKNRLKRQRKKEARGKQKGSPSAAANGAVQQEVGEGEGGEKKRKLAGGAGFKFKTADERDASGGEEDDEEAGPALQVSAARRMTKEEEADELRRLQEEEARAQPAKEAGIVIQDDD